MRPGLLLRRTYRTAKKRAQLRFEGACAIVIRVEPLVIEDDQIGDSPDAGAVCPAAQLYENRSKSNG